MGRRHRWVRDAEIPAKSRAIHEHRLLSQVMDSLIKEDRLNVKNLEGAELVSRRMQLIEEVHVEDPSNPSWEGSEHYLGDEARKGGALIAPSLKSHVAAELQREAQILKEKRKSKEARKGAQKEKT